MVSVQGALVDVSGQIDNPNGTIGAGNTANLTGDTTFGWQTGSCGIPAINNGFHFTLDSGNGNTLIYTGDISGAGGLTILGGVYYGGTWNALTEIGGAAGNTYGGATLIGKGTITLSKSAGDALRGAVTVGRTSDGGARVVWTASDQLNDGSDVSLVYFAGGSGYQGGDTFLNLAGYSDTINSLVLDSGTWVETGAGGVLTVGTLTVGGVVQSPGTYTSSSSFVTGSGSIVVPCVLMAQYDMEDQNAGQLTDISGNGRHAPITDFFSNGGQSYTADSAEGTYAFAKTEAAAADWQGIPSVAPVSGILTLAMWAKVTAPQTEEALWGVGVSGAENDDYIHLFVSNGSGNSQRLYVLNADVSGGVTTWAYTPNDTLSYAWNHVAVVLDANASRVKIYVNGADATEAQNGLLANAPVTMGGSVGLVPYALKDSAAQFDDVRFYDGELSPAEIAVLAGLQPPGTPASPNPADAAPNVAVDATLSWSATDASGAAIYLWQSSGSKPGSPTAVVSGTSYVPPADLSYATEYTWQVVASNILGTTAGSEWTFTTAASALPPATPGTPSPSDGAASVLRTAVLSWSSAGADGAHVYIWESTGSQPGTPTASVSGTSYDPANFTFDMSYSWRVVATNAEGATTGAVWTFTAESDLVVTNGTFDNPNSQIGSDRRVLMDGDVTFGWQTGTCGIPVENAGHTFTLNTGNGNPTTYNGALTGTGNSVFVGRFDISWAGWGDGWLRGSTANTVTGSWNVWQGALHLDKDDDVEAVSGNVSVGEGGQAAVYLYSLNQIADTAVVTLFGSGDSRAGRLVLRGYSEAVGGLAGTGSDGIVENTEAAGAVLTLNVTSDLAYGGEIRDGGAGALGLVKNGSGTQLLHGAVSASGAVNVNDGTFGGTATIAGATTVGAAMLAPGASTGVLTINNSLSLASGTTLAFELGDPADAVGSGSSDLITGVTDLVLDGTLNVTAAAGFGNAGVGSTWRLITYSGTLTDNGLTLGSLPAGYNYALDTATAGQVNLEVTAVTAPPGTPTSPSPASGATGVTLAGTLSWSSTGADSSAVYLWRQGDAKPGTPTAVVASQTYDPPGDLDPLTTYAWQVVASNLFGTTAGPEWSFTTSLGPTNYVWDGGGADDNWNSVANYVGDQGFPSTDEDTVTFTGTVRPAVNLNGNRRIGAVTFAGPTIGAFTLQNNTLTLPAGGHITYASGGEQQTISSALVFEGEAAITNAASGTLSLGVMTGSSTLTFDGTPGSGSVAMTGDNAGSLTGTVVLNGSTTLRMEHANCLGSSAAPTILNGGTINNIQSTAEPFTVASNASFNCWGFNRNLSGDITLTNGATLSVGGGGGNYYQLSGTITGDGNLLAQSGGLGSYCPLLSGNNTYSGRLTVRDNGTIVGLSGSLASADIVVETGATFKGAGGGTVHFTSGRTIVVQGTVDVGGMSFDLTGLSKGTSTLIDYGAGGSVANLPADLRDLLAPASQGEGWEVTDTGSAIVVSSPSAGTIFSIR